MHVISVTPVSRGVVRPLLVSATTLAIIVNASSRYETVHHVEGWLALVVVAPIVAVTLTRVWRWRSHKVHVTNERIVVEGGVLRHHVTSIELGDVVTTRLDQRVHERLTRRGYVLVETMAGAVPVGLVRHPASLCRLIDAERVAPDLEYVPFDTVYRVEEPEHFALDLQPAPWPRRRVE